MILLDTTPIVALCDPRDALHPRSLADLDRVSRRGLFVGAPILTEACFLLQHPIQRKRLERLLVELAIRPLVIEDEARMWQAVFRWLEKYAEHEPDWTDGYLAVASSLYKKTSVWTYDSEFRTTWRKPDGTKIRLAVH